MKTNYLEMFAETIRNHWGEPALTDFCLTVDGKSQDETCGNHYSYGELYVQIVRIAEKLQSIGVQKGDRIAICDSNSANWVVAYFAIAKIQGVAVMILHSQSIEDITRQLNYSEAKVLFTDAALWGELNAQSSLKIDIAINLKDWSLLHGEFISMSIQKNEILPNDCKFDVDDIDELSLICFTSGSTGVSKGIMARNRGISSSAIGTLNAFPNVTNNNYVSFFPFSHMSGYIGDLLPQILLGRHIYVYQSEFTLDNIYTTLSICQPYVFLTVPKIYEALFMKYGDNVWKRFDKSCRLLLIGGSSISSSLENKMLASGIPMGVGYGLTEATGEISITPYNKHRARTCGRIVEGTEARISEYGEILVKGENVMLGYYKDPEATDRKIDKEGWLHTGDKGHLDEDSYLYVEGRLEQDMIVLPNGENIRPDNIESLINALPEVSESIVLARDGKLVAIVVPQITNQQSQITNTDLRRIILRNVNPSLPLYSQLYDVEITDVPLQKTEKQTIKRYLYK